MLIEILSLNEVAARRRITRERHVALVTALIAGEACCISLPGT